MRWADAAQATLPILWFATITVGLSVVFAIPGLHTGFSVLPALRLHSVINWWSLLVPIMPAGSDRRAYAIVADITIMVAVVASVWPAPHAPR